MQKHTAPAEIAELPAVNPGDPLRFHKTLPAAGLCPGARERKTCGPEIFPCPLRQKTEKGVRGLNGGIERKKNHVGRTVRVRNVDGLPPEAVHHFLSVPDELADIPDPDGCDIRSGIHFCRERFTKRLNIDRLDSPDHSQRQISDRIPAASRSRQESGRGTEQKARSSEIRRKFHKPPLNTVFSIYTSGMDFQTKGGRNQPGSGRIPEGNSENCQSGVGFPEDLVYIVKFERCRRRSPRENGEESPDSAGRGVLGQGGCRGPYSAERIAQQKTYRRSNPARVKRRGKSPPRRGVIPPAVQAPPGARPNRE